MLQELLIPVTEEEALVIRELRRGRTTLAPTMSERLEKAHEAAAQREAAVAVCSG